MSAPKFTGGLWAVLAGTVAIAGTASEPCILCEICNCLILWDFRQVVDSTNGAVVQSVRTPACHNGDNGFGLPHPRQAAKNSSQNRDFGSVRPLEFPKHVSVIKLPIWAVGCFPTALGRSQAKLPGATSITRTKLVPVQRATYQNCGCEESRGSPTYRPNKVCGQPEVCSHGRIRRYTEGFRVDPDSQLLISG